jgi:GT2 family glycosyltransferase
MHPEHLRGITSVIIPTRGPSPALRELVVSLDRCVRDPSAVELVVVHDGTGADFADALRDVDLRVTVGSTGRRQGPGAARNAGSRLATGERLVFIDDDVLLPQDWYAGIREAWTAHPGAALLGGTIRSLVGSNAVSQAFETFVIRNEYRDGRWVLAAACIAVHRDAFETLGGFDERLVTSGEDWDLCRRAHAAGLEVVASERFHVLHRNPTRYAQLLSRARSYARSFGDDRRLHPSDVGRPLQVGRLRLPRRSAYLRPWTRAVKSLLLSMPLELRARVRVARATRYARGRRIVVLALHMPWFLTYWTTGVWHELQRNRGVIRGGTSPRSAAWQPRCCS